ncbi:DNA-N1-methyladenine dioxygenase [Alteromonadaceae bacterium Bs31]|nr:DNA-N1-methyladenine dioxygenase [Alteromonadaceae bacterium Bs31]
MTMPCKAGTDPFMQQNDLFSNTTKQFFDLGGGAEILYWKNWMGAEQAELMRQLIKELPWQQPEIRVAGQNIAIPRKQCWYGDAGAQMHYSGKTFLPLPWSPLLSELRARVVRECEHDFNSVLVNFYRNGQDSVGWHADDEPELGDKPSIASLSLGAKRRFQIKHKNKMLDKTDRTRLNFELGEGDLLLMCGSIQESWQHSIPKTQKLVGPRVNLTFRLVHKY